MPGMPDSVEGSQVFALWPALTTQSWKIEDYEWMDAILATDYRGDSQRGESVRQGFPLGVFPPCIPAFNKRKTLDGSKENCKRSAKVRRGMHRTNSWFEPFKARFSGIFCRF